MPFIKLSATILDVTLRYSYRSNVSENLVREHNYNFVETTSYII